MGKIYSGFTLSFFCVICYCLFVFKVYEFYFINKHNNIFVQCVNCLFISSNLYLDKIVIYTHIPRAFIII